MDGREFARIVKTETIDGAVRSTLEHITSPQVPWNAPESADTREKKAMEMVDDGVRKWQLQNEWYRSLDETQRLIFIDLLRECAKLGSLNFCSLFDGTIVPGTKRFKISAANENDQEVIVNLGKSDRLGALVFDLYVMEHGL